jgi:hypothetical protein
MPSRALAMYTTIEDFNSLVQAFADHTLPRSQWTHQAHLTVALWYFIHYSPAEATNQIRKGIQQYNAAHGIPTTPTGGYHETLTLFWCRLVQQFLADRQAASLTLETVNALIQRCCDPKLPFVYYSRDRLLSLEARITWVEPDLQPLPKS